MRPKAKTELPDLWLIIPLVCLLATFKVWDFYFNSADQLDRTWVSTLILSMGSLFSLATGFFIWNLQRHHRQVHEAYHELKEMQEQLIQAEKLASVGRVVAGIVHELNTPLVTMQGYTRMLMKGVDKEEDASNAALIHRQAERCHRIVRDLLTYSRWDTPKFRNVDMKQLLDLSLANMPPEFHAEVQVEKQYAPAPAAVEGDPEQLQRVFLNLLMNAWQAMQENNTPKKRIRLSINPGLQQLQVRVQDNGPGIPEEIQMKIFEPFYTTKAAGKGTGLGLSLSQAILLMHQGRLELKSEEGQGAVFTVEIPFKKSEELVPRHESNGAKAFQTAGASI
jgi:two-component system NtrC family sensor kinase